MASCACSGIRSCLLCENKNLKSLNPKQEKNLKTLTFCIKCQKLCSKDMLQQDVVESCSRHDCFEDVVSGIAVIEDFITKDEEEFILAEIQKFPWQVSQSGRQKQVGECHR